MAWLSAVVCAVALAAPSVDGSGKWTFKAFSPDGEDPAQLTMVQDGDIITGSFESFRGAHRMEGAVKGDEIRFTVRYTERGETLVVPFEGRIEGGKMSGQFTAGEVVGRWTAERAT